MPTNVTPEFIKAKAKYAQARTREEKIHALEEMLSTCPTHKGCDRMRADMKSKLAKFKKHKGGKAARHITTIAKQGDAQVTILGMTQSGKSTLLRKLTNAKPKISKRRFTTTTPQIGSMGWKGVKIQLIEIPSTFYSIHMNLAQNCDGVITIIRNKQDEDSLEKIIQKFKIRKPMLKINGSEDTEELKQKIWKMLNLIRIYCKEQGKKPVRKALVLKKNSTVRDAAHHIHKDFLKFFKFARVWGDSAKYAGERVGLEHKLKDGDVLEIRI